jgi:hypothetical protein
MNSREKPGYRMLFNHDGWCVFMQSSPYQDMSQPVGRSQVLGYVDEVADAGCDVILLSPVMSKIPAWPSEVCTHWRDQAGSPPVAERTKVDVCYNRLKAFMDGGGDLMRLSRDRAKEKRMACFVSWRMNEGHDVRREGSPLQSRFWREHPQYRIGGANAATLWGRALDFSHAAVRDYQFELIRELCTRYEVDGLELDFLRFEKFFPQNMPRAERFGIMTGFVKRVRGMLDEEAGGVPLCARVQSRMDLVAGMGLDLVSCVDDGLIQMVNVAPFIVTQPDAEIEEFRAKLPSAAIYGEITHCTHYGRLIETGCFEERKITREQILSTARSFLARGCDGISTFNYVYTRDFTLGLTSPETHREPDFEALRMISSGEETRGLPAHHVLTDDRYSRQLPVRLNVEQEKTFRLYIPEDLEDATVRDSLTRCVLRVESEPSSPPAQFEAAVDERVLDAVELDGPLFPSEDRPADADHRGDFLVPPELLKPGWNQFTVRLVSTAMVTLQRVELAMFGKTGDAPPA